MTKTPMYFSTRFSRKSICSFCFFLIIGVLWLPLIGQAGAVDPSWQDISGKVSVNISNPVRSRRNPDATVVVQISNISGADLSGPLRLVITDLDPATGQVSIANETGVTDAGDPFFDLTPYLGNTFVQDTISDQVNVVVSGGGSNLFSFNARVEQEAVVPPESLAVKITSPATLITVGSSPLTIQGSINDPAAVLTVNGAAVPHDNGLFEVQVALEEGHNTVLARAIAADGAEVTDSISVALDTTPPYITIESPLDGAVLNQDSISVSGLINDIVRGTVSENQANVVVNGKAAVVSNRSYLAEGVNLVEGDNTITVTGTDEQGNTASASITVHFQIPEAKHIEMVSGQNQSGKILSILSEPLKVKLVDESGQPVAGKPVVYRVIQGDGMAGVGSQDEGQGVLATSDAEGVASTAFKLGSRSGKGNHRVRARAVGFDGEVVFFASAETNPGNKVSINSGNNQRGAPNQALPQPLIVAVTDEGANLVQGAEVEFKVTAGGGRFQNGQTSLISITDSDGRATASLTLGEIVGLDVHRVSATLLGTSLNAGFTASALQPADPGLTGISGIVLDNQDNPLPNVTVRVEGSNRQGVTDAQGQFKVTEAPVGPVHLIVDGSTTTALGEWPTLSYNIVTIAGADNPLPAPVYMVKLDTERAVYVGKEDKELTLPEVPGFKLKVKAGSVTFPDGAKEGYLSVTPVNANKIPMTPPNGMQPQFIVTIQPAGAKFDPPAPLTLPNVDGHAPGAQVEMYSYDHDLEEFVSIGLGTVSTDGSLIESNPGIGVIKAGWHCGSQPGGSGCCGGGKGGGGDCPICKKPENDNCNNGSCVNDDTQDPGECKKCSGGVPVNADEDLGECKTCKDGKATNDPNGATCDDGKYCSSFNGEYPGPDQCVDGQCVGKEFKRRKKFEDILEGDSAKFRKLLEGGMSLFKKLQETGSISPITVTGKVQKKVNTYSECCEELKTTKESTGSETTFNLDAFVDFKTPQVPVPFSAGILVIQGFVKVTGRLTGSVEELETACFEAGDCLGNGGGKGSMFLEGGLIGSIGVLNPDILSGTISLRGTGSIGLTSECGVVSGEACVGPVQLRGKVTAIGFISYTVVGQLGTPGCIPLG